MLPQKIGVVGAGQMGNGIAHVAAAVGFDVILTDINMPIMDGLKLVSMVRNDPAHKAIPIIIITTEGAEEDRKRGLALGANAYVPKPIQTADLLNIVNQILGGKG